MKENLSLEELKMENERLKNKTEKIKLFRNIVAAVSIFLSLAAFLLGVGAVNNNSTSGQGVTPEIPPTSTTESNNTQNNSSTNSQNNENTSSEQNLDDEDDDDLDDNDD